MISASRPIGTIEELRDHLQYAVGLELTTIPAYLCALYTIHNGSNTAAYDVIQSIVMEEMLHMALAANVLNAVGGVPSPAPVSGGPSPVPTYPATVPFINGLPRIHLQKFSPAAIDDFLAIEQPDEPAPPSGDRYGSIGAFYGAIVQALRELATPEIFAIASESRSGCQLRPHDYYGGAGALIEVVDLDSAVKAISEIVLEGEGAPASVLRRTPQGQVAAAAQRPGRLPRPYSVDDLDELPYGWKMYSHFARFSEIRAGRQFEPDQLLGDVPEGDMLPIDWRAVRAMTRDPQTAKYAGTWAHRPMIDCNAAYTALVDTLYEAFNGGIGRLQAAVPAMYALKYRIDALLNMPSPLDSSLTLGPAFEYGRGALG